jgi:hypothetical protein
MQASNSAGKLHLLDLIQIKTRLGEKWQRMAAHVERFFETAIRRSMGPGDTYSRLDELSYLVLFRALSPEEAQVKCQVISEEICQRLFGEQGMQVSLRNLVAHVDIAALPSDLPAQKVLDAHMERVGKATIVSRRNGDRATTVVQMLSLRVSGESAFGRVSTAEVDYLYRPVWDAVKQVVVTYLCQPSTRSPAPSDAAPMAFWSGEGEQDQAALDKLILDECVARTVRLHAGGQRVLIAMPVSFATVSRSRLWSVYAETFRRNPKEVLRDMACVVTGIDAGVPHIRLGQELPRLANFARIFCIAGDGGSGTIHRFAGTGVRAVGISIDPADTEIRSIERLKKLGRDANDAGLDAFALGLPSTSLTINAMGLGIRYLEGPAVRPAVADPRLAFAQSVEYLYQSKLAAGASV